MKKVSRNYLSLSYPELMNEWHPTKNKDLNPNELLSKSHKKVWWMCNVNPEHEWESRIADRTDKGQGCPFCSGRKATKEKCLAVLNPELAKEWHPTKNGTNTPYNTMTKSGRKFWWQCEKGHEWEASPGNRNNNGKKRKCPYCAGFKYSQDTSLASVYPYIAKEWHPTKNQALLPLTVSKGYNKKIWWQCSINPKHEWEATINTRKKGHGCPYCAGILVTPETSLGTKFPHLIPYWHPTKNGDTTPFDIMPGSHKKYWWICEKGHEWQVSANGRTRAKGCAYCLNKLVSADNNLAVVNPKLAKEWHPIKNGVFTPYDVLPVGAKKVWWICSKNSEHEWEAKIANRKGGRGCPICAKEKQSSFYEQALYYYIRLAFPDVKNTFKLSLDESERNAWKKETLEIDIYIPSLNMGIEYDGGFHASDINVERDKRKSGILKLRKITLLRIRTDKLPHWTIDPVLLHNENKEDTFETCIKEALIFIKNKQERLTKSLSDKIDQTIEKVNLKKDRGDILFQYTEKQKQKSLGEVHPILSKEWHPTKNSGLKPFDVLPGSGLKVWWRCNKNSNHEWEAYIYSRLNGTGCPYCSGRRATKENCLAAVNPELAKQWHPTKNDNLTPYDVKSNSNLKVWWQCLNNEEHSWEASCNDRSNGRGCPFCSRKRANRDTCLATVNPELAKEWHPTKNRELTPYNLLPNSNKKVWWKGTCGHEWEAIIANRNKGNNCPKCSNRVLTNENSLAVINPELASEWHPTKNGKLNPIDIQAGSHKKVWWRCKQNHEWLAAVDARNNGSGCEKCSRYGTPDTCFATKRPDLISLWHPTKNGEKTPYNVKPGSQQTIWWQCIEGHEFTKKVHAMVLHSKCPKCSPKITIEKTLGYVNPIVSKEWHPTKNGNLTPDKISYGSAEKAWWRCQKHEEHEWEAPINARSRGKRNCPYCLNQKVDMYNCLAARYPNLAKEWHPTKNGKLTPYDVMPGSRKNVWWYSEICGHEWEAMLYTRKRGDGCPICAGKRKMIRK